MENIGQSNFLPVDNMAIGVHKSLDQSCRNYAMPGQNTSNGCCRLCFKGNCHLQELFPGGYTEELLISKIFECTTVEITFANDPDALICYSCVAKIEEFHRYREQCRSNDVQHKNSKRRMDGKMHPVLASTLIPPKYVKKEIDSDGFEISASEFYPVDAADQSYGTLETSVDDGPIARIANLSGVMDSTIPNEDGVRNSGEDENLLELMPDQRHDEFSVSYSDMNEGYENNNEIFCELPIKEEPQDINDDTDDWHDFGMHDDDDQMDRSTNLIPLIDNCSYSTNSEHDSDEQRTYREVYNGTDLVCLMQDGFLYVQVNKQQWRCRIQSCGAAVYQFEYSQELETNGVNHAHSREVENSATDMEILHLVENGSPPPLMEESDDDSFHYVKNIRKGISIVYKGFKYNMKHKKVDGTTYWKCRFHKSSCSAGLYQTPDNKFTTVGAHTHEKPDIDILTNKTLAPYVSSVSTEGDELLGDKSSKGKIKLRIARQTDATDSPSSKHSSGDEGKNKIPLNQKDAQGVIRRSYDYKMVKNANGRIRLHFDGNLYVRESSKKEATGTVVKWRCRRNYDMCGVSATQYEDGLVEVTGDHDHSPIKKTMNIPENCVGTTAYHLLPTFKGGEALVLDGYRYIKAYNKTNGISLWRCTGLPGITCRVKIVLAADGVAYVLKNVKHDHDRPKPSRTIGANTAEVRTPTKENRDVNGDESVGKKLSSTGTESNTSTPSTIRNKVHIATHKPIASSSGTSATSSNTGQTAKVSSKLQHMHNYRIIKNKKGNKALVHGGFRYCKVRTRQDGAISWFCRMNKKTCHVGLYQYPDGKLEWINNNRHNHNPTDPIELPKKVVPAVKKSQPFHMDDETFVNNEWYFVRNRKNGTTLIHAGYRYHKKASRVDKTSMWRCSRASRGCRAGIVMHADETIAKLDNFDHDHPAPNALLDGETIIGGDLDESIEESPNTSTADIQAPELNLVNFNGCIEEQDDPEANMRTLLSTMLDVSDEPKNKSPSKKTVLSPSKAHYRYVKNRRLTQSLVFRGYRYSRSSMQIRADGSVKWVCQMNKKTCRVAVKVLKDGSLEMDGQKHNHPQLVEDMEENDDNEDEGDGNDTNVSIHDSTIDNDSTIHQEDEMDKEAAHDYYFALNRSNGTSLIFQRNRYSKENTRPDGSTIWRCMVRSDCVSKVILHADGTCAVYRNPTHHHPPLEELPKALHYTDKLSSVSVKSPPVEKPTTTKLTVKGDMLIYKLNRMKKVKSFSDGTAIFKCAEMDSCPSKVKLQYEETEDGRSSTKVIFESAHNHQSFLTDTLITNSSSTRANGKSKVKSALKMQRHSTSDSVENVKDYQLFTNNRGHVSLVYEGYRFSLRGHGVNGNTSWKCRANRTCSAYVTFTEEGRVVRAVDQVDVMPHNHAINGEYIERAVPIELHELHPPAANLSQFVSNWMNGLYKNELGAKTISTLQPSISHNDGKKTIYHKNFSYKLQTIKNGREFWRCTMFKARACRAALFCCNNGTIIQHENGHEHNHEPIKSLVTASQQNNSERKSYSSLKGKTHVDESSDAFYGANETFDTINEVRKTVKRSHSSMLYDDQLVDESSCAPAYQIVEKDGVKMLHHEKHRYVVILDKREGNTDERKRWRCSLWNSRHQCPVELTVLDSGELHFETDLTHNHRPPPPESQEVDRVPALNTKGTKKYELLGRNLKTVFYKGHKFFWKEQRNNWTFYACMCALSYECTVTVKIDSNGMLYECSNESHNHSPTLQPDQANESPTLKRLSEKVKASREARLANCPKNGSDDYSFVGNSLASKGYRYWLHNKLSCGLCVYRCRQQKAKGCNGSVYMDKDTQLIYQRYDAKHNHEPLPEDKIANTETPVASSSSSDSCKPVRPISPQPAMAPHSTDNEDDHDLLPASAIESNEPQTELPKNDDVILTPNYTFVKNYLNKNQLLYEDYLYEFVPLSYRNGSDKFYGCLFSECSASVKLLPCGNLKVLKANQHTHERPDLTDYRDVGCGSANFTTLVPPGSGKKAKILFEGYMYYDDNSQPFQDDAKVFYCYSNVSTKEKSKSNERCSVSLELLPNNRVIVTGTHNHPEPKLTDSGTSEKSHSKLIVLHGRSFRYLKTEADGTVVWQCFDDPKCKAKVYEKPNGKMVCGTIKHVLRHAMTKLTNNSATEFKISLPTSAAVTSAKVVPKPAAASSLLSSASNSIVPCSTGSLRTKWYQGNRYNFYLTRRDGVQYWRCSKRIEEKCETGILCYPSGTIVPYNSLPHTHPPLNAAAEELRDNVPSSPYTPKDVAKLDPNDQVTETVSKYPLQNPDTSTPNDLFVRYKGVLYTLRKRNTDGLRIYRCRNQPCTHTLIVNERGKIISKKPTWHSCVKQPGADALVTATSNAFSRSASGLGFDKPEIEDPDDLVDQNGSTTMEPLLKRIRLDIEMVEENDHSTAPEEIVQTEDSLSGMFNTETDAVMEEELIEESYGEMQHCLNAENEASDTWEQDYLEQEFDSPDAIEDATANSETDVRRPNDGDQTHEIQTTSEHSRESCAPKASLKVGTN